MKAMPDQFWKPPKEVRRALSRGERKIKEAALAARAKLDAEKGKK